MVTAASFVGDGSGLTGVTASGVGIEIKDSGSVVGTAGTIDFGGNLTVSPASAGIVTITSSGGVISDAQNNTLLARMLVMLSVVLMLMLILYLDLMLERILTLATTMFS